MPEPHPGLRVKAHLPSILFGNPNETIAFRENNPITTPGGGVPGKQAGRLFRKLRTVDNDPILGIEPRRTGVKVVGAHKHRLRTIPLNTYTYVVSLMDAATINPVHESRIFCWPMVY